MVILISHQSSMLKLADDVIMLKKARVEQVLKPTKKHSRPPTDFPKTVKLSLSYQQSNHGISNHILSKDTTPQRLNKITNQKKLPLGTQQK
jgi:ABC-type proline/glycine betaine transport system ATPase subunit